MLDQDFADMMYQGWSKTTGAKNTYWQPTQHESIDGRVSYSVDSIGQDQSAVRVAAGLTEDDAAFITAIHGCFGDMIRRWTEAIDHAELKDVERDATEQRYALALIELAELRKQLKVVSTVDLLTPEQAQVKAMWDQ